ncbi:VOC family protein [Curtobacterium sp. MCSS17_007]|uniref:VOC family protein n=1 Tax=Curtobacterium sp. MCSS17_007 TaxID=2175646 RepID=UPI000DA79BD9|nr:VOC family protein [Curtobacterium sp. MCSS17_007]WIE75880.1 VOC family protein [Curtobacterium sp. MCSS17_007]
MASGVAAVWVPVGDMQRAVAFYRDALGLEVASESDDWSEIDANGLRIGLNGRESASASSGGGAVVSFQPDGDIEDEVADLRSKGVEFAGGISEHPWGKIVPFQDSEGNDLQLYSPPQG